LGITNAVSPVFNPPPAELAAELEVLAAALLDVLAAALLDDELEPPHAATPIATAAMLTAAHADQRKRRARATSVTRSRMLRLLCWC
jgi:hypothetical protein